MLYVMFIAVINNLKTKHVIFCDFCSPLEELQYFMISCKTSSNHTMSNNKPTGGRILICKMFDVKPSMKLRRNTNSLKAKSLNLNYPLILMLITFQVLSKTSSSLRLLLMALKSKPY